MPRPYCDLNTDVKPWLNIDVANTTHDTTLTIIRDSVEQAVLDYTDASFDLVATSELLDSNGSDTIVTRNTPIDSVSAVYFWTGTDGLSGSLIDPSHYSVEANSIVLQFMATPQRGRSLIRVDYEYGYDGVPPNVKHAILMSIEADFRRKGDKSLGRSSRSKKDESESFGGDAGAVWNSQVGLANEAIYKLNSYRQSFEFPVQPMAIRNP